MVEEKWCAVCGRVIEWRRKWARDWPSVRYCSASCRRTRLGEVDAALEAFLREQLARRRRADPRDAAAALSTPAEQARRAARRIIAAGEAVAIWRGRSVDASAVRGPFEIVARA